MRVDFPTSNAGAGIKVLSFFSGAGGLDLGFEAAGFEVVHATDYEGDCCETLRMNRGTYLSPKLAVVKADIRQVEPASLPTDVDLIIGGPPCQSFSASGRRAGGAAGTLDDRGNLFSAYCQIIGHVRPKAFVFENVRGILGTNGGEDWRHIVSTFAALGYEISYRLLDALDYGAPQQRERMLLVGHKLQKEFLFPQPLYGPDSQSGAEHITAGEALGGIKEDENLASLKLTTGKYAHLLPLVPPGQNYLYFTAKRGYPNPIFAYRSRFSDFLYKANPQSPVKTIIASPGKYTGPFHWDNRYFSIREYMRLQGFPDGYKFYGTRDSVVRQIGNSVSPRVAFPLALAIAAQVFERSADIGLMSNTTALTFDKRKRQKAAATRAMHATVATPSRAAASVFRMASYNADLASTSGPFRVEAQANNGSVELDVICAGSAKLFAQLRLSVFADQRRAGKPVKVTVRGFGVEAATVQAMWDAVDDWVQRSSNYHSLFELYGHFTEPHPSFDIEEFRAFSSHPIVKFAMHVSDMSNCSKYLPRSTLVDLFGGELGTSSFSEVAQYLRSYRFDVRSHETNVAIDPNVYMVAYPFTLPARRQMNFKVRERELARPAHLSQERLSA